MLHPAELEAGDQHAVVFPEGHRDPGEILHPVQCMDDLAVYFRQLGPFRRICLPVIDGDGTAVPVEVGPLPFPGDEGEEIGADQPAR